VTPARLDVGNERYSEAFPKTARVAVLWNSAIPPAEVALKELRAAAPVLAVDLQFVEVPGPPGFAEAFAAIMGERADALFVFFMRCI